MEKHCDPTKRHDFVLLFDIMNGNPNGDPDCDNMPRIDPSTQRGIVTDVCIKRKIRNAVSIRYGHEKGCEIYVRQGAYLCDAKKEAYKETGADKETDNAKRVEMGREYMQGKYYDVRMFGGVLVGKSDGYSCGQICGPMQLVMASSVDTICPKEIRTTRIALEKREPKDKDKKAKKESVEAEANEEEEENKTATHGTIGRKYIVAYALYVMPGFFTPHFAQKSGVTFADMEKYWTSMENMFVLDRSASRGMMSVRGIYIFTHDSALGDFPAHKLFDGIHIAKNCEGAPKQFSDYEVAATLSKKAKGITLTQLAV